MAGRLADGEVRRDEGASSEGARRTGKKGVGGRRNVGEGADICIQGKKLVCLWSGMIKVGGIGSRIEDMDMDGAGVMSAPGKLTCCRPPG